MMKTKVLLALMPPILILWLPRAEAVINNSKKKPGDLGDLELSKVDKPGVDSAKKRSRQVSKSLMEEAANRLTVLEVPKEYEDDEKPIPIFPVYAVIGGKAELPCDIKPTKPDDDVYLVLWYRHEAGKPLYSFDVRGRTSEDGKHWSDDQPFGNRAFFRVGTDPTYLLINDVKLEDEDIYRCRIDYRDSPTRNVKLNLTVVVQPCFSAHPAQSALLLATDSNDRSHLVSL